LSECNLQCNGIFHTECIKLWQKRSSTCPLCRQHLVVKGIVFACNFVEAKDSNDGAVNKLNYNLNNTEKTLVTNNTYIENISIANN